MVTATRRLAKLPVSAAFTITFTGTLPDGTPYHANDPEALAWVHVTESLCFLESYIRYRKPHMSMRDRDRYFAEMAQIGACWALTRCPSPIATPRRCVQRCAATAARR